ncbi:MAG TPA: hypothetical protein VKZ50_00365 [bacterium]|nr:hypothetical protein [bacterium]
MAVATSAYTQHTESLPVFQDTVCRVCGHDDAVGVRHHGTVLCLDCYRRTARAERLASRHGANASIRRMRLDHMGLGRHPQPASPEHPPTVSA